MTMQQILASRFMEQKLLWIEDTKGANRWRTEERSTEKG